MKKTIYLIIPVLLMIGCSKEDNSVPANVPPKKDYSAFLSKSNPVFKFSLDKRLFEWNYGIGTFQSIKGYQNADLLCDSTNPWKVHLFGLTSNSEPGKTRFWLNSSPFNITTINSAEMAKVFSIGVKQLGQFGKHFNLTILLDGIYYESSDELPGSEIEILKTQEFSDEYGKKNLKVWFRIDALLQLQDTPEKTVKLSDGRIIADFWEFYE